MKPVYVIGHRNPDTDAICSAIGYAEYLRSIEQYPGARAARCGDIPARTQYALEQAGVEAPELILDVRPTARRICQREVISAGLDESVSAVYHRAEQHQLKSLPLLTKEGTLAGMVSLQGILKLLLPAGRDPYANREVESSLDRICKVLNGRFIHDVDGGREEVLLQLVGAMSSDQFEKVMQQFPADRLVVVSGNRPTIQLPAIEYGVRCLVITGGHEPSTGLVEMARARGVSLMVSPWDTATTTLLIRSAKRIELALESDFLSFSPDTPVAEIRKRVRNRSDSLFPVVDGERRLVGIFSKADLINPEPIELVLVDHNELGQAVHGADEARILEVVDHHRLGGGIHSSEPIRFCNEPVGSTSTIVAFKFRQCGRDPSRPVAICLMAGIISDTLNGTSPTTVPVDREMLQWLSDLSGVDVASFAGKFFATGSVLETKKAREAIRLDCKAYAEHGWSFSIAQIEENGLERFQDHKQDLHAALEQYRRDNRLDFSCLFITDIIRHVSLLILCGDERVKARFGYPSVEADVFRLEHFVSRKKQLLPYLAEVLRGIRQDESG